MERRPRPRYAPSAFEVSPTFGGQIQDAIGQSPWWMMSIALHVMALLIASVVLTHGARTAPRSTFAARATNPVEAPDDDEPPPETPDPSMPEPVLANVPTEVETRIDQDLPFDDAPLGNDGVADAPFDAPGTNAFLGIGPGAGNRFGRGRGGNRDGGPNGATAASERAVEDALRWLAAHQSPDGRWEAAGFHRWCDGKPQADGPDGGGMTQHDVGVTGLATLAFLGAGYTHRGDHEFARTVSRALRYLRRVQDQEGFFGPRAGQHAIYDHAAAALAMVEAYGMTESPVLRRPAQKALDQIGAARNPYFAWRYGTRPGDNDTSVTGWMMMALKSAKLINAAARERGRAPPLAIDEEAFDGIRSWMDRVTDPDTGRVGYLERGSPPARPKDLLDRFPADRSESMTAVGVLARIFTGEDPKQSRLLRRGAALCVARPPVWDETSGDIDMYYWYYATLALHQVGGSSWRTWNEAMKGAILDHQRRDTDFCQVRGSWDPAGPWGAAGGRVYATALMALCLEVYYRYERVFGK